MPYCRKCGTELKPADKFCPGCGSKTDAKSAPTAKQKQDGADVSKQAATQPQKAPKMNVKSGLAIVGSILGGVLLFYLIGGFEPIENNFVCPAQIGKVLCGYCPVNENTTTSAHAGKCRYCPQGYTCSGDVCWDMKCSGGGVVTPADQYCQAGYCLSNGHCCPSSSRYYCEGSCYSSTTEASSASNGRCASFTTYC